MCSDTSYSCHCNALEPLENFICSAALPSLTRAPAGALTGVLDSLLTNRRLVTLVFAVLDVALILVLIKVFRSTVMPD